MLKPGLTRQSPLSLQAKINLDAALISTARLRDLVLGCLLLVAAQCHGATRYFDTELSYLHEDNLAHAARASEALNDDVVLARARVNWLVPVETKGGLLASLAGEHQRYTQWQALSRAALAGQLNYRYKPWAAFNAPWFEAGFAAVLRQFQDSAMRDGGRLAFEAATGRALTDRINVRLAYRFALDRSWRDSVFDAQSHRISGNVDWHIERTTFYTTLAWQRGDIVSSVSENADLDRGARAQARDSALGDSQLARIAYRFDADTLNATLGINFALAARLALDVAALYFDANGETGANYRGYRVTAGVLYRF